MADAPDALRDVSSAPPPPPPVAPRQNPSSTTRTPTLTAAAAASRRQSGASQMAPPAVQAPQSQFLRFRLNEFQRVGTPTASPAGQCSRFRVSDFVQYGTSSAAATNTATTTSENSSSMVQTAGSTSARQPRQPAAGAGSYSVLQMDIDAAPQQTSNMVAMTGGRGVLHKVPAPPPPPVAQFQTVVSCGPCLLS